MQSSFKIKLRLSSVAPLLVPKLEQYAEILDLMDSNNGWFPFSNAVIEYFEKLGVIHWAELYFPKGAVKWLEDHKTQIAQFNQMFIDELGDNPTLESTEEFLNRFARETAELDSVIPGLEFLEATPNADLIDGISEDEREIQRDTLIGFLVYFYNDLSISAHREPIYTLVARAENNDYDALTKAIQIDPTIIHYFNKVLMNNSMRGNVDFFDSLSYRIRNSPRKGANKHPLLWIFLKDLHTLKCLHKGVTCKEILDIYQMVTGNYPKLRIDDEQTVQRQRRKFKLLYS